MSARFNADMHPRYWRDRKSKRVVWRNPGAGGGGGGPVSSLLTGLVCYYEAEEAAGQPLVDSHTGGLNMTAVNAPGTHSGIVGNARSFVSSSNQDFKLADQAAIRTSGKDFTIAVWGFRNADGNGQLASKDDSGQQEWDLQCYNGGTQFVVYTAGSGKICLNALHPVGSWFLAMGWFDSVAGISYCSINNGTPMTLSVAGSITNGTAPLAVGARWTTTGPLEPFDGYADKIGYWITAPGAGGVLTAAQRTALYGAGTPPNYPFTGIP